MTLPRRAGPRTAAVAAKEIDFGLVVKLQLSPFGGMAEGAGQFGPSHHPLSDGGVEHLITLAARLLGLVHRGQGVPQYLFSRPGSIDEHGACASRDEDLLVVHHDQRGQDAFYPARHGDSLGLAGQVVAAAPAAVAPMTGTSSGGRLSRNLMARNFVPAVAAAGHGGVVYLQEPERLQVVDPLGRRVPEKEEAVAVLGRPTLGQPGFDRGHQGVEAFDQDRHLGWAREPGPEDGQQLGYAPPPGALDLEAPSPYGKQIRAANVLTSRPRATMPSSPRKVLSAAAMAPARS